MSNRESNIEDILMDYLTSSLQNENIHSNTHNHQDEMIRILDRYQRNIELYNRNVSEIITCIRHFREHNPYAYTRRANQPLFSRYWTRYFVPTTQQSRDPSANTIPTAYATDYVNPVHMENATMQSNQTNNENTQSIQMNQVITETTYSNDETVEVCPITLDHFVDGESICKINQCGHIFKRTAFYRWIYYNGTCPVCRCSLYSGSDAREHAQPVENNSTDAFINSVNSLANLFSRSRNQRSLFTHNSISDYNSFFNV